MLSFHHPVAGGRPTIRLPAFVLFFLFSFWFDTRTTMGFINLSPPAERLSRYSSFCPSDGLRLLVPPTKTTSTTMTTTTRRTTLAATGSKSDANKKPINHELTNSVELESCWSDDSNEAPFLSAKGDTQMIGSPDHPAVVHSVVRALHDRKRRQLAEARGAKIMSGPDDKKIALIIEGGGMRGCVTAGMVCAIDYLGLRDCVDIVYGSSAGSIIGAYFITGQLPWFGPEVYYDQLTTAGKSFIDTGRLLRALGLGMLNPKLVKDVLFRRNSGKPLLNLDFLLDTTMQNSKPLNWETFVERQKGVQPLKIIASGLKREEPLVMTYEDKHFESIEELAKCMHASALLPGIAGPVVNLLVDPEQKIHNKNAKDAPKFVLRNNFKDDRYEPLADALVYAPMPYDVALAEGATHMIVLRSKPDGGDVIGKGKSIGEKLVWSRFFLRKNKLPKIYQRLTKQLHKKLYAKNVLELNEAAKESPSSRLPPTLTVAIPGSIAEVPRLEVGREAIFEGVRDGFARAYDALVEDPALRGKGYIAAKQYFPDEILDYDPLEMLSLQKKQQQGGKQESAFETYLRQSGVWPKAWEGLEDPPLGCSSDRTTATRRKSSQETTGGVPR